MRTKFRKPSSERHDATAGGEVVRYLYERVPSFETILTLAYSVSREQDERGAAVRGRDREAGGVTDAVLTE